MACRPRHRRSRHAGAIFEAIKRCNVARLGLLSGSSARRLHAWRSSASPACDRTSDLASRLNKACTVTKKTGTISSARMTTAVIPPMTIVPRACWLLALAPAAIVIGATPKMNARPVITMGRKRIRQASTVASLIGRPCSRKALANSMIRMPSLAASPIMVTMPTVK